MTAEVPKWTDLGLTYEQALHGVQTGVAHEIGQAGMVGGHTSAHSPKHLRTGLNAAMVEHSALAYLLMRKGVITHDEYVEELRLAMNNELARYEALHPRMTFR